MKSIGCVLFCLLITGLCSLTAAAETQAPVALELGDRLGEHLGLVTYLFLGAIVVLVVISIISVVRRK